MEKIDRLGWAAGLAFTAYGVRVGIRVSETDVLKRVEIYLPPAWRPASSPRVDILYSVVVGGAGSRPGVRRFNLLYANALRVARPWTSGRLLTPLKRMSICISLRRPQPRVGSDSCISFT